MKSSKYCGLALGGAVGAVLLGLGSLILPSVGIASASGSVTPLVSIHALGVSVGVPNDFDKGWIAGSSMSPYGLGKVSVLEIKVSNKPSRMLAATGPQSYEADVLTKVCANGLGFRALPGSHSADIADAVSSHLYLIPEVQHGVSGFQFGSVALKPIETTAKLIRGRLLTLAPTMKAHQCMEGVATFAVPLELGSPFDQTHYFVDLVNGYWIFESSTSIVWS